MLRSLSSVACGYARNPATLRAEGGKAVVELATISRGYDLNR